MNESKESSDKSRLTWSRDLGVEIIEDEWKRVCHDAQTQTINTRYKLLQFKWIMRTYITPESLLHRFDNNNPDVCIKCGLEEGILFHCLWSCPNIKSFWEKVIETISDVICTVLPVRPRIFILGVLPPDLQLSSLNRKIVILCSLLAKHCIAVTWKSTETPTVSHWLKSLSNCLALEKLTYASKGKMKMFFKVWGQFMGFLESLQARDLLDI